MTYQRGPCRRVAAFTMAAGVMLSVNACGTGDEATPVAPSTRASSPPEPSTTTPAPAEVAGAQAIAAYLGMWRDMAEAAATSDWRSPALARHATATALSTLSRGLYADHYNGLITTGQPENTPVVTTVQPRENPRVVTIVDCGDDSQWTKHRTKGPPVPDAPGGRRHIDATAKTTADGMWRITDFAIQGVGTC